ncbi:MAG: hypothetical protein EB084_20455 [Proteobacteria bacterium]|nr:hypothetical protein [Pseudomonadota bacterium]
MEREPIQDSAMRPSAELLPTRRQWHSPRLQQLLVENTLKAPSCVEGGLPSTIKTSTCGS